MIVETLEPAGAAAWDAYVAAHPDGNLYHARAWKHAAERAYALRAPFLVARERTGGPLVGALPLFVSGVPGHRIVQNGLFGAYGRVLADDAATGHALVDAAVEIARREGARHLLLKALADEPLARDFVRRDRSVIATMPLAADENAMWKRLRDKTRNMVRKAQKHALEVRRSGDDLAGFYDVLAENMHRKGTPIYGIAFFRELVRAAGDAVEVVTLARGGEVVSGALVMRHKATVYVPFASSRPAAFSTGANHLLYWEVVREACGRGFATLDFGRSPQGSSTLAFKTHWGATVVPQPFYVHPLRGPAPTFDASAPSVQRLVRLWQKVPRNMADKIGPTLCKWFLT